MFQEIDVNINGKLLSGDKAKISVFDRGFLFGDSIYEVTYTEDGQILFLEEHLDRLETSANIIDLKHNYTRDFLVEQILQTLKVSKHPRAYIRLIITRGNSLINLDPTLNTECSFIIITKALPPHPQNNFDKGLYLTISSIERNSIRSTDPRAKSGNYLNNVMALNEAKKKNADDAIMMNAAGHLTEGTTFNIWMVKENTVYTPSLKSGLLKGITRDKIIEICHENNIPLKVKSLSANDFLSADEMFISSSTRGIMPVNRLDSKYYGESIKQWPLTASLISLYDNLKQQYKMKSEFKYL